MLKFVISDNIAAPMFLPMLESDVNLSVTTCHAAILNPNIPISEYMRKEFFYRCYMGFAKAVEASP